MASKGKRRKNPKEVWNEDRTLKMCLTCKGFKNPESDFRYKTKCQDCYDEYQKEYRAKHREELARKKRELRERRKGSPTRTYTDKKAMSEKIEKIKDSAECFECHVSELQVLGFMGADRMYLPDESLGVFGINDQIKVLCFNCAAKVGLYMKG